VERNVISIIIRLNVVWDIGFECEKDQFISFPVHSCFKNRTETIWLQVNDTDIDTMKLRTFRINTETRISSAVANIYLTYHPREVDGPELVSPFNILSLLEARSTCPRGHMQKGPGNIVRSELDKCHSANGLVLRNRKFIHCKGQIIGPMLQSERGWMIVRKCLKRWRCGRSDLEEDLKNSWSFWPRHIELKAFSQE
jgi:hypothetical protein